MKEEKCKYHQDRDAEYRGLCATCNIRLDESKADRYENDNDNKGDDL